MVQYHGKIRDMRQAESYHIFEKDAAGAFVEKEIVKGKNDVIDFLESKLKIEKMQLGKAMKRGKEAPKTATYFLVPAQKATNVEKMLKKTLKRYPEPVEYAAAVKAEEAPAAEMPAIEAVEAELPAQEAVATSE